ncbi:MAG: HlyD family secretion protein [Thermoanaerobaculia bacterium]
MTADPSRSAPASSAATSDSRAEPPTRKPPAFRRMVTAIQERPALKAAVILVALVIAGGIWFVAHRLSTRISTDDAFVEAHVQAIAARAGGTVLEVRVEENQTVAAGDVLVELDPRDFRLAVDRAHADLSAAEAGLAAAHARVPIATLQSAFGSSSTKALVDRAEAAAAAAGDTVEAAEAHLAAAASQNERAQQDVARLGALIAKDEVTREEYDHAVAAASAARAAETEARQGVEAAANRRRQADAETAQARAGARQATAGPQQVSASRAEEQVAEARVAQSRVAVAYAEAQLADATIHAPQSGIVGKRNVEPGQTVAPGQPLIALVPGSIWVTANFKETQLGKLRPGQKAKVHVDAYDLDLEAHVESVGAATGGSFSLLPASNSSGNFVKVVQRIPVRLRIDSPTDPERPLRPGMSVVPTVIVG